VSDNQRLVAFNLHGSDAVEDPFARRPEFHFSQESEEVDPFAVVPFFRFH